MKFKQILQTAFLFFIFFNTSVYGLNNKIIARVGTEIITNLDLKNEIKTYLVMTRQQINQENVNKSKDLAFRSLIRNAIKLNEIKKYKVDKYNPQDLENYLNLISKNIGADRSNLKNFFKLNKLDYEKFRENYINELLWNTLIFSLYKNQITINPIEIEEELKNKVKSNKETKKFLISEIEIPVDANIENLYESIINDLKKESFDVVAKKYSISMSKEKGGMLGWFDENSLSQVYLDEVSKLEVGQLSKPIRTVSSYIILKLDNIKEFKNDSINIEKLKEEIIVQKKEENLKLFSRSHFSNLETSILIDIL